MSRSKLLLTIVVILTACTSTTQPALKSQPVVEKISIQAPIEVAAVESLPVRVDSSQVSVQTQGNPNLVLPLLPSGKEALQPADPQQDSDQQAAAPSQYQPSTLGPDSFPEGVNPLTGLKAADPSLLSLPPALISVSNFPVSARPQAGLSFSPYVFEVYIGEGMTRFLAMFYGSYPQKTAQDGTNATGKTTNTASDDAAVGPIRSGRLSYESVRNLYNGFLVMASASAEVGAQLNSFSNIFGSDSNNINSALIDVTKLKSIAEARAKTGKSFNLTGNRFNEAAPQGGSDAPKLQVFYNFLNQVQWTYDTSSGAYLRYQDQADGSGKFVPATDRLTGNQLAFNNVVVLFAQHSYLNRAKTLIDIDLLYTKNKAMLFRDGKAYPIYWSTENGEYEKTTGLLRPIRFVDANGNPIALKPGNTWVEIMDVTATLEQKEPGAWFARFYNPNS